MAKKSSKESSKKKKSGKKSKLSGPNSAAMKSQVPKENPFESIWSRRKFDVLGKKRKDEERRRVGHSRSLAIEKRQKTLLKEYEQSAKSSVFVDKRIGENSEGLGEFDKAILRSQRERQLKVKKKSKYNLSDGEEDDFGFQDGYFPERDDFEDEGPLEDYEAGRLDGAEEKLTLGWVDLNGTEDGPESQLLEGAENRHKSKKEVMEDIIFKSKFFKAQKAKEKEENEEVIEQLDKNFSSLVQSEALLSLTQPDKMKALKALVNSNSSNDIAMKETTIPVQNKVTLAQEKPDHYDQLVGEMALDMRARPSDRTKTPEELAQEEKERLERLEEERQKRMIAVDESDNEDADNSADEDASVHRPKHISGDDLGDSFYQNAMSETKAGWLDKILQNESANDLEGVIVGSSEESDEDDEDDDEDDADESGEDTGEDENPQSLGDWEQSDDDNIDSNLDAVENEPEEKDNEEEQEGKEDDDRFSKKVDRLKNKLSESRGNQKASSSTNKVRTESELNSHVKGELPYTIEAPKTFEELTALLEGLSDDQIVEAIRRIRTFNAISIAAENRKKIQVFYGLLLQYFAVLANKKPLNFNMLNMLVKPLMDMSAEIPYFAAICARQRLLHTRMLFCEEVKNTGKSGWPTLKTIFLLRLWSMIFPCSDFRHAVMTPAMLLMSEYLMRCRLVSGRDIAIGSFLCAMLLSVVRQSQKFCPEAITFIQTILMAALNNNKQEFGNNQLHHLMEVKSLRPLLRLQGHVEKINSLDFLMLMELPDDSPCFTSDNFRASMLSASIGTLKGFVNIYEGSKSFPEIFLPVSTVLLGLAEDDLLPDELKDEIKEVANNIQKKSQETQLLRQPLRWQKQKHIKTAIPKFEDNFVKGRDYDPDRERAERKKLKRRLKKEARGAKKELRKDNYFLLGVKERDRARTEQERAEMYGRSRAFLQEQEHAAKSGQLGRIKKRRR